ncbi:hypothetical protein LPMP_130180 [Leishmania panamensis]|uniref:Uncharacterized protein n=2 Tax=Leishmania guyanensis species complex TaxID=38579 RepID=A0A088RKH6_LEIPA|nr:hypothetical protein LPMP_130180 [Leishmania panamensis]AIN96448.1 hypothetical protein LPMP_130180 [Leishmania panamensis]CCM13839.1 hypothetical protein, conserved [Leishmania guyanensis]
MSLSLATALYADAARLYRLGDLHHARSAAEEALFSLSPRMDSAMAGKTRHHHGDVGHEESADSVSVGCESSQAQQRRHHRLFGNTLLLLSCIYMAVQDYIEAERLLVTCDGYWRERLTVPHTRAPSPGTSVEECACCSDLDEGLAGVAYNRAVLRLEQLQCTLSLSPSRGDKALWVTPLVDVRDAGARLTHSPIPSSSTAAPSGTPETVYASVMALLLDAQNRLAHTLGPPRGLLADVLHTIGVCHYETADYITALEAWQRSMTIRLHLHAQRNRSDTDAAQRVLRRGEGSGEEGSDGTEELKLALTMEHVAQVYRLLEGRSVEALKLLDTVAGTRRKYLGPTDPLCVRTLAFKGALAAELGHTKLARALFDRCSAIYSDTGPETPPPCSSACAVQGMEQWRRHQVSTSSSSCSSHLLSSTHRHERAPGECVEGS